VRAQRWVTAAAFVLAAACEGKSPEDRVAEHDLHRGSWERTAQFVGDAWIDSAIPATYAHRTLVTALEELSKERHAIEKEPLPAPSQLRLQHALERTRQLTERLDSAIVDGDPSAAARAVGDASQSYPR
jgi:hypothetical protein